jgi:glycosyltransferase involved in cell wall biosynthesis
MAAGLPVISTTAAGEITNRIRSQRTGLLVPRDDVEALKDAMLHLYDKRSELAGIGREASQVVANHTPQAWAKQIEGTVNELLSQHN